MIKIVNLTKSFGNQILFDDISFHVNHKERIGIVGRNGYGKSTLIKIIAGREQPELGEIIFPKNYRIAELSQHIEFSETTVLAEACKGLQDSEIEETWRAKMVLSGLGFAEADFARHPNEFSGGFQIRINLAKMLLSKADLLLLDEPTNYLDILSMRWLERFLKNWNGEFLLVTHDRTFMDAVTTHTMMIHRKKIRKVRGGTKDVVRQIAQEEEVYEQTRIAAEKKQEKSADFIRNFRSGARSAGLVQSRIKMLDKQKPGKKLDKIPEISFRFHSKPFYAGTMLMVSSLAFGYDADKPPLIEKLNLNINPSDRIGIIGRNGAGKTTLLRLLAQQLSATAGTVKPKGNVMMGYFGQTNRQTLNPQKTILEELYESGENIKEQEVRNLCASLLFRGDDVHKKVAVLSGGEKSRVGLGKIMLHPYHLLFLDEPTNHLDMESCDALCDALMGFEGAVVFVSHNEDILSRLANRLVVFDIGGVRPYELTYPVFLEEIGWKEEANEAGFLRMFKKHKDLEQNKIRINHKDWQRKLKQTEREISKREQEIEILEQQNIENTAKLQAVAAENDHIHIRRFSERAEELIKNIDRSYAELEKLLKLQEELQQQNLVS